MQAENGDIYSNWLGRDVTETQRMDQHALGWLLHPLVARLLQSIPTPRIADLATGTGIFLRWLAGDYRRAQLDGYDVSSDMWQSDGVADFSTADVKKPFPDDLHGSYDLVHIRYLIIAMAPEDWEVVLQNAIQLLRPGGVIQWEEPAMSQVQHVRGRPDSTCSTMTRLSLGFRTKKMQEQLTHGWSELPDLMKGQGLSDIYTDVTSSDRLPETRQALTENGRVALFGSLRMRSAKNLPGAVSNEEIDRLEKLAIQDIASGCYVRYDIHTAVGFKPER
ncbi:MAG: hypothetical protein M1831_003518 [Alyxoria varia]|nr:MAG: hypothetical protein M1831_003518 [Alyxoria varia]